MNDASSLPLVSLCVSFYNQERFVEDAVQGALSQTYENLEIVLSDDNSTDSTFQQIERCIKDYNGPHKIIVNRNEHNLGLVPHVNKVLLEMSHGQYIFVQGGDDISLPNRVTDGVEYFKQDDSIYELTCPAIIIDKDGNETGKMKIEKEQLCSLDDVTYLKSPSFMCGVGPYAIRREMLDFFGPLNDDCPTEDSCFRFRTLLLGKLMATTQYNMKYRIHGNNISIGDVVYKLDTHLIAKQYRTDLEKVKEQLPAQLHILLQKKIRYYERHREIQRILAITSFYPKRYVLAYILGRLQKKHILAVKKYVSKLA